MKDSKSKYLFVHYLRGIAVLSVMFTHFGSAFFNANPTLSSYVNVPTIDDRIYPWVVLLMPVDFQGFLGVFGVTVFFMISGFVIPMSVEKYTFGNFLTKRFFRLFPTYFCVFTLNLLIAVLGYVIYHSSGIDYQHSVKDILWSYTMGIVLYFNAGANLLDPVAWTLAIEIFFYLVTSVVFNVLFYFRKNREIKIADIIALSFILDVIASILSLKFDAASACMPWINVSFLIKGIYLSSFMLIGTTFFLHTKGRISTSVLVLAVCLQYFGVVHININMHPYGVYIPIVWLFSWLMIAILTFSFGYAINEKIREHKLIGFMADISYPLYLCHSYVGYFIMGVLMNLAILPKSIVMFIPFPVSILVAWLVHKYIEMPTSKMTFSSITSPFNRVV
ncbi:TPA: acyltransferase family protein [Escherichia coli]|jgi:peptidoglycan/LPS O-acetylase OafA/YrhL|uniref:acyltransferase family protein n=1 Tax=Escherichia coli TaxID=562 RepID=UPI0009443AC4|nr:acyltransferase [Escherichia coli]OKV07756.1 hypothetical protein AWP52_21015 [Escherichia coli]OKW05918.1 hypothetical protein AWP65_08155 [Escherichia coli]